jgi:hypothetical protein
MAKAVRIGAPCFPREEGRLQVQLQAVRRLDEKELGNRAATIWIRAWFSKQFAVP